MPTAWSETQACQPFRAYRNAAVPAAPPFASFSNQPTEWEKDLVHQISHLDNRNEFATIYWKSRPTGLTPKARFAWLKCILYYSHLDADGDGIRDWSAIQDQKISRVLQPSDSDLDGDGIENVLDAEIYRKNKHSRPIRDDVVPAHLRSQNPQARPWQNKLRKDFGLLAIDHNAKHSPFVLEELHGLLSKSFSEKFVRSLTGVKVIYAFTKHDDKMDIAAYHPQMRAISIGGDQIYLESLDEPRREALLSTLAHEVGHAVLLEKIRPQDLRELCEKNGWKDVFRSDGTDSFYAEAFFRRHPGWPSMTLARQHNFFSAYSYSNAHEWFADAFAEVIMATSKRKSFEGSAAFAEWLKPRIQ